MNTEKTVYQTFEGAPVALDLFEKSAFEKLKKMVDDKLGLNMNGYREEYVKRRFDIRLKETGTFTYGKYVHYLNKHPEEFNALLNNLAINYTTFFRDSDVYSYIEKTVFPELFVQPTVRIWSAGSSTGQEPYSLAMLALKVMEHKKNNCRIVIYASDVDREALAEATRGLYAENHLEGTEKWMLDKYFIPEGKMFRVKDSVKQLVKFGIQDLMKPYSQHGLDLVLCRNVMIYFAREAQQLIHMNIFNAIRPGGIFIAGKTEILTGEPAAKFQISNIQCRVYKKP
jgi:chemotaxis methyl-accepting protein methylase